jgi:Fur family peroxide stress response transcriptional regulator
MTIPQKEVEQRLNHFETVCRDEGIKVTHQRIEIFREVAQSEEHPDADGIYQRVRHRLPTVSLDTVYRTLWLLNDLGLVTTLGSSRTPTRFDANLESHHHFVCRQCGLTRDFVSDDFDSLALPHALSDFGEVERAHVEVRGICRACLGKEKA